jgi:hypothetical protein
MKKLITILSLLSISSAAFADGQTHLGSSNGYEIVSLTEGGNTTISREGKLQIVTCQFLDVDFENYEGGLISIHKGSSTLFVWKEKDGLKRLIADCK